MTTYEDEVNGRISMATSFNVKLDINEHIFERAKPNESSTSTPLADQVLQDLERCCQLLLGRPLHRW